MIHSFVIFFCVSLFFFLAQMASFPDQPPVDELKTRAKLTTKQSRPQSLNYGTKPGLSETSNHSPSHELGNE